MTTNEQHIADQLIFAADIIKNNKEWQIFDANNSIWVEPRASDRKQLIELIAAGYDIRIKPTSTPEPDPYAEAKGWLKEDGKIDIRFGRGGWITIYSEPMFNQPLETYRRHDPNREVKEWFEKGGKVESRRKGTDHNWDPIINPNWYPGFDYRKAPEPVRVPWSFEDHPKGAVWVKGNFSGDIMQILGWTTRFVWLPSGSDTYSNLLRSYTQLDGSICGKETTP